MNSAVRIDELNDPLFCRQLARVVSSMGYPSFAAQVLGLIEDLVQVDGLEMSEWTLDMQRASVERITVLGGSGLPLDNAASAEHVQSLLPSILHMDDPLLIQRRLPAGDQHSKRLADQCSLVAGSGSLRRVICVSRQASSPPFSLQEMSVLKNLADTLLKLLEQHSRNLTPPGPTTPGAGQHSDSIDKAFSRKLERADVPLSAREQEVCVGFLSGTSVPELATRLQVKNSSIESYLKRAASKLGVKGRHGLASWMARG
ncbi:helix-turn-helix transcriptional regulator [Pseudomonas sp. DTU_2021_1001937_2_SI_NGA_ILE_001]|uniref:helix-turn-helix transcriptional regulator n=1 Tax=Pseudomonas sp. DTU_2021_1001937_2_SI_NGA_ILE_001 TaxID=3077589 RepID=UPI0028FC289D|nr:helix-turn-helix transcriptional regulator [Pseudomonas sp. DTU_2021_1001937_2_SI_NGA_ILE_001]WNW09793.1 helix-turn-helix transcriptional regulator [Pseudomonas sp. DTU_2021_1001937_2_SI_NGA_ILE_001]